MTSSVEICNLALTEIGETEIVSLSDASKSAVLCNSWYERSVLTLLRMHNWSFAKKRVELALSTDTPAFDYSSYFALPSDYIKLIKLSLDPLDPYEIENGMLACNYSSVSMQYVASITNPNLFDSLFVEALSLLIASKICKPLTGDNKQKQYFDAKFTDFLRQATHVSSVESNIQVITAETWLGSRY